MKKTFITILLAGMLSFIVCGVMVCPVSAHQTVSVGGYLVEIGWLDEPPVVGQRNAIVVNISLATPTPAGGKVENIDVSRLNVSLVYGGQSKALTLQPLSEDSQNQFIAPILPTRPGKYTVALSGSIGTTPANAAVQPEEVLTADSLQFPLATDPPGSAGQTGGPDLAVGLAGAALVVGLAALGTALFNLRRSRR
jgi:hypothetical protein